MANDGDTTGSLHPCSVVTIGTYDGVHLGHRRLIEATKRAAAERGCKSVVVTFREHPATVLRPEVPIALLCTYEEKIALLRETGVDEIVVLEFDEARAHESAENFVLNDLVGRLGAVEVVVGSNFRFGFQRRGDVALLVNLGQAHGFTTTGIDLVLDDAHHSIVSSTRIRALIRNGEMAEAGRLLGRPYRLTGTGDADGTIHPDHERLLPPAGRYVVNIETRGDDGVIVTAKEILIEITDRHEFVASLVPSQMASGDLVGDRFAAVTFIGDREPTKRVNR